MSIQDIKRNGTVELIDKSKGEKIVDYYFKNVKITDIAKMLNVSEELVKHELTLRGIDIVPQLLKAK